MRSSLPIYYAHATVIRRYNGRRQIHNILEIVCEETNEKISIGTNLYEAIALLFTSSMLRQERGDPPPLIKMVIYEHLIPHIVKAAEDDPYGKAETVKIPNLNLPDPTEVINRLKQIIEGRSKK